MSPVEILTVNAQRSMPLVIPITLFAHKSSVPIFALIDCGASISFMHRDFALQHDFTLAQQTLDVSLADG
jgi:hypothetical protein